MFRTKLIILFSLFHITLSAQEFVRHYLEELTKLDKEEQLFLSQTAGLKKIKDLSAFLLLHDVLKNTQDSLRKTIGGRRSSRRSKNIALHLIELTSNDSTGDLYKYIKLLEQKDILHFDKKIPLTLLYDLERKYCRNIIELEKIETGTKNLCKTFFNLDKPITDSLARIKNEKTDKNIIQLMQLGNNDTLVEIGAGEGKSLELLSMYANNLRIFVTEIDSLQVKLLKSKVILLDHFDNKNIRYTVYSGSPQTTNLPNLTYPNIIIHNAFHHFSHPIEMLCDIKTRMNKESRLYISDAFKDEAVNPTCEKHFTRKEFMNYFYKSGFLLASEKPMSFYNFKFCEFYIP